MNNFFRHHGTFASIAGGLLLTVAACEKKTEPEPLPRSSTPSTTTPNADNTARNKGDGSSEVKTPTDQSQSSIDVKITAEIRRAVMDDKNLSSNAKNCKIITDKAGVVTLRGVVDSQSEKDVIEGYAKGVAGTTKVDNQLEVKTN